MRWFWIAITLGLCLPVDAAPHRLRIFPNPSLVVFSIAQGPDGMLWLAAADGLYRFDGFRYVKIDAYPFLSANAVGFTRDGSLWGASFEGLARVIDHRFEIVLREPVQAMAVYPDQVFVRLGDGLGRVALDGSLTRLKHQIRRDLSVDSSGRLWGLCMGPTRACWIDPAQPSDLHFVDVPQGLELQQAVGAPDGRVWVADGAHALLVEKGREISRLDRQPSQQTNRPSPLLAGRRDQVWFLGETVRGLTTPTEFRDRADHDRFPPLSGFEDAHGNLWKFAAGQGLVEWNIDPEWERSFPENFANEPIVQVVLNELGGIDVATSKNLYFAALKFSPLMKQEHRFDAILPLNYGGFLASIRDLGFVRISADGRIVEHVNDLHPGEEYREIVRDLKGRVWVGTKRVLLRLEGADGSLHFRAEHLPGTPPEAPQAPVDMEVDAAGRLWVGYSNGIAWLDDQDQWHQLAVDQPVTLVRSFTLAGGDIWVTHRRAGSFSRLHRQGEQWHVISFPAAAGYTPVDSYFIKRDSRGWIWRGSPEGVFVSDGVHVAPNDWLHFDLLSGLASKESSLYGFFEDPTGAVWLSGDEGLTRLHRDPRWFQAPRAVPPPQITRIEANGREFVFPASIPTVLPSDTTIVRIDVGGLDSAPFRQFPLRYRLLPGSQDWSLSRDGVIEFRNLRARAYSLELSYTGDGTSDVGTYRLQIGSPVSWTWPIGLLAAAGVLFPVVRFTPWFERTRFRIAKTIFLLRRRRSASANSSSDGVAAAYDYSGETFASRYHLARIISRGGFSIVYEAHDLGDLRNHARVAVKVLNRSSGGESQVRDRFAHEVAALRSIDQPGIVKILDSWVNPAGEPCLAMPFLDGPTLRAALSRGPISPARTERILRQTGTALMEVHRHGIVHRDLKPENMILLHPGTDSEQAVIIDFGTAGLKSAEHELAATTLMAGSLFYMAPERLTGRYSPASDVFSLGVIVLEMLTGKRLSDLDAMFSEPSFGRDLEKTLRSALSKEMAKDLAARLAPAYDPEPHRRPTNVKQWSESVADALRGAS